MTWRKDEVFPSDEHYFHERVITAAAAAKDARIAELEAERDALLAFKINGADAKATAYQEITRIVSAARNERDAALREKQSVLEERWRLTAQLSEVTRERDAAAALLATSIHERKSAIIKILKSRLAASETDRERLRAALEAEIARVCKYIGGKCNSGRCPCRPLRAALAPALATEGEA